MSSADFAAAVLAYCARHEASVTSWYRTRAHNTIVGGVSFSAHTFGLGLDVIYDLPVPLDVARAAAARLGLLLIREGDHDHLQPLDWPAG